MDRLLLHHLMSFDDHRLSFCNQPAAPLIRRKADKSPESAVEPSKRRPALTATYEANPPRGSRAQSSENKAKKRRMTSISHPPKIC